MLRNKSRERMQHQWRVLLIACAVVLDLVLPVVAQTDQPRFEVASIKLNISAPPRARLAMPPGRFVAVNVDVPMLLSFALEVPRERLRGLPPWTTAARLDIDAKMPEGAPPRTVLAMIRRLLAEELHLQYTMQSAPAKGYALRRDARQPLGRGLTRSPSACVAGASNEPRMACGLRSGGTADHATLTGRAVALSDVARLLGNQAGQPIIDQTGLTGLFDLALDYDVHSLRLTTTAPVAGTAAGPSIFTALQEQWGLKLEPVGTTVNAIVIQRLDPPIAH
jgi:uncharacterized protein (TIGR03435 family)